jgi:hypothetical protein
MVCRKGTSDLLAWDPLFGPSLDSSSSASLTSSLSGKYLHIFIYLYVFLISGLQSCFFPNWFIHYLCVLLFFFLWVCVLLNHPKLFHFFLTLSQKKNKNNRAEDIDKEHLLSKCEILNLNPGTTKNK